MCKPLNVLEIIQTSILKQSDSSRISLDETFIISTRDVTIKVSTNICTCPWNTEGFLTPDSFHCTSLARFFVNQKAAEMAKNGNIII